MPKAKLNFIFEYTLYKLTIHYLQKSINYIKIKRDKLKGKLDVDQRRDDDASPLLSYSCM